MSPETLKVVDHPHLIRDAHSKAIINRDDAERRRIFAQRAQAERMKQTSGQIATEVNSLRGEVNTIKTLLSQILEKLEK